MVYQPAHGRTVTGQRNGQLVLVQIQLNAASETSLRLATLAGRPDRNAGQPPIRRETASQRRRYRDRGIIGGSIASAESRHQGRRRR